MTVTENKSVEIEINGKKLTARPEQTIIQVADEAGIYIPRFCYHKKLTVAANCRMCLVEVEKSPKALPACATPVMPGMKVFTKSQKTIDAQRAVMEFLLINHPLDCPVCDQGGECELQDLSMGYGSSHSHYDECKRSVADQDIGPLIATEMTRCIYCTRCVRFGDEIAGLREMGVIGRGEHQEVGTYVAHMIKSEVSGNITDLCPVGALTNKPFSSKARAWELNQHPSIAPHDCLGSNLHVHTRYGTVMRVVAQENLMINDMWLSDRDRYSYTGLYHPDRVLHPMARINGKWEAVGWEKAFELAANGLQQAISAGSDKLGALASPNSTLEEFYLLQKITRALGSSNIDHRLREINTSDQVELQDFPRLPMPLAELENQQAFLIIGSNLQKEQPLASLRVRKAAIKGSNVFVVNSVDYKFHFPVAAKHIVSPNELTQALAKIVNALQPEFSDVTVDDNAKLIAQTLRDKEQTCIVLGALAQQHPESSTIRYLANRIAELTGATLAFMSAGANSAGAFIAGAIPHKQTALQLDAGLSAYEMLAKPRDAYLLVNVEPELDCANAQLAREAMQQAKFTVALSIYRNPLLEAYAHVIFPMTPFTETSGTFVNVSGQWQSFQGVATPYGEAKPAWKILRVLGNFLHLDGFEYETSEEVKQEVKSQYDDKKTISHTFKKPAKFSLNNAKKLMRIGEIPPYSLDSIVRRALPLQETQEVMEGVTAAAKMHADTARELNLQSSQMVTIKQGNGSVKLPLVIDERVAKGAVLIAGGIDATNMLGDLIGEVEIL